MSAKHTPGPWILMTVPTSVGSCHKIGPFPNATRSATFACVYADGHRLGIDDECDAAVELAANARLIAAAPALLQALRSMLDDDDHDAAKVKARAAIAAATGEKA
jgi:hypothetical protein